ncbi:MAG: translation initiation factor IF-2 subunit beta [Candidatus Thermoplasmatota archaeon]|nr:translation initiation factor IF-2 subunit beta [Candidatus Thermoplasmatota archaeon]
MDYKELLARARTKIPEQLSDGERFKVPEPDVLYEGKTTVLRNFGNIVDTIRRDKEHFLKYLLKELGTPGTLDGTRVIFQTKIPSAKISERVSNYVETYVICSECRRPDTHIVKDDRTTTIVCDACGAKRPVIARKARAELPKVSVGNVIEISIDAIGQKGDGIGRIEGFTVFVPGAQKGTKLNVKIKTISGKLAFGEIAK